MEDVGEEPEPSRERSRLLTTRRATLAPLDSTLVTPLVTPLDNLAHRNDHPALLAHRRTQRLLQRLRVDAELRRLLPADA